MAETQPKRSDEQLPGRGVTPQLSLVSTSPDASQDAVWFTGCAWCGRIQVHDRWLDAPAALELIGYRDPLLTHGICPGCFDQVTRAAAEERRRRNPDESWT